MASGHPFRIRRALGAGAFAVVVQAETVSPNASGSLPNGLFALKIALPSADAANPTDEELTNDKCFAEEAMLMSGLQCPYIVAGYGLVDCPPSIPGFPKDFPQQTAKAMALEFMEAGSLARLLVKTMTEGRSLYTNQEAYQILLDVAMGLLYLHSQTPAIAHRDLKMENLLLTKREGRLQCKLADLGLHAMMDKAQHQSMLRRKASSAVPDAPGEKPRLFFLHTDTEPYKQEKKPVGDARADVQLTEGPSLSLTALAEAKSASTPEPQPAAAAAAAAQPESSAEPAPAPAAAPSAQPAAQAVPAASVATATALAASSGEGQSAHAANGHAASERVASEPPRKLNGQCMSEPNVSETELDVPVELRSISHHAVSSNAKNSNTKTATGVQPQVIDLIPAKDTVAVLAAANTTVECHHVQIASSAADDMFTALPMPPLSKLPGGVNNTQTITVLVDAAATPQGKGLSTQAGDADATAAAAALPGSQGHGAPAPTEPAPTRRAKGFPGRNLARSSQSVIAAEAGDSLCPLPNDRNPSLGASLANAGSSGLGGEDGAGSSGRLSQLSSPGERPSMFRALSLQVPAGGGPSPLTSPQTGPGTGSAAGKPHNNPLYTPGAPPMPRQGSIAGKRSLYHYSPPSPAQLWLLNQAIEEEEEAAQAQATQSSVLSKMARSWSKLSAPRGTPSNSQRFELTDTGTPTAGGSGLARFASSRIGAAGTSALAKSVSLRMSGRMFPSGRLNIPSPTSSSPSPTHVPVVLSKSARSALSRATSSRHGGSIMSSGRWQPGPEPAASPRLSRTLTTGSGNTGRGLLQQGSMDARSRASTMSRTGTISRIGTMTQSATMSRHGTLERPGTRILSPEFAFVYNLTGSTGSSMYMAPEVCRHEPYNESVDTYSFAVVMYEVLSRTMLIFTHVGQGRVAEDADGYAEAAADGYRPEPPPHLDPDAWELITACWAQDPLERPPMKDVVRRLQDIIARLPYEKPIRQGCCGMQ